MLLQKTYQRGRIYRRGELICSRARVTIGTDIHRLGLTRGERSFVTVAFVENTKRQLHDELRRLVSRRGAAAKRVAEQLEPITVVVVDDRRGELKVEGKLQPPDIRVEIDLHEVEFKVREESEPGSPLPTVVPLAQLPGLTTPRTASEPASF